jgi:hypothetical protein
MAYGSSLPLDITTSSTAQIRLALLTGPCHIQNGRIYADSGVSFCHVTATVDENEDYLSKTEARVFVLFRAMRPDSWMTISMQDVTEPGQLLDINVSTKTPGTYDLRVEGQCSLVNGKLLANSPGDCRVVAESQPDDFYNGYLVDKWVHITKQVWSTSQFNLDSTTTALRGSSFDLTLTNTTSLNANLWVEGGCSLNGVQVTMASSGANCTLRFELPESDSHERASITKTVTPVDPVTIATRVISSGWLQTSKLPMGQWIEFNATAKVLSGSCSTDAGKITAKSSSGSCEVEVGGYQEGINSYTKQNFTIALGPAKQSWLKPLPVFTSKKLSSIKYTFITSGQPITNYGTLGTWKVTTGCKIVKSGSKVTIDMGKLKKCVATVSAISGFKTSSLTKSWTFTR